MNRLRFACGFLWGLTLGLAILTFSQLHTPPLNPDQGTVNCQGCTVAYDLNARGVACVARSFDPDSFDERIIPTIYPDTEMLATGDSPDKIKTALLEGGGRGLLRWSRETGHGHMVAYIVRSGRVYIVDAQTSNLEIPLRMYLMIHKGKDFQFARLDTIDYVDCDLLWKIVERRE